MTVAAVRGHEPMLTDQGRVLLEFSIHVYRTDRKKQLEAAIE